jgi:hypothetical protein
LVWPVLASAVAACISSIGSISIGSIGIIAALEQQQNGGKGSKASDQICDGFQVGATCAILVHLFCVPILKP